ncbi:MAG: hypothetical protein OXI73_15985 [Rhodospirillales bacterium]|nr:hypothetical protein [Rhodospirillales bacterium]
MRSCEPKRQKIQFALTLELTAEGEAEAPGGRGTEACVARRARAPGNLKKALARVRGNRRAPSVDGMTVDDMDAYLSGRRPEIRSRLLDGTYQPLPARRVAIPNASDGLRPLGLPTVLDRLIQQAVMHALQEDWDESSSTASYGFRPGRYSTAPVRPASASTVDVPVEAEGDAGCLALTRPHAANAAIETPER